MTHQVNYGLALLKDNVSDQEFVITVGEFHFDKSELVTSNPCA